MGTGVSCEAGGTQLAARPCGVVDAAQAVPGVRVAELGRTSGVCIPTAVTRHTPTSRAVEASAAAITLLTTVPRKATVTHWEPIRVC